MAIVKGAGLVMKAIIEVGFSIVVSLSAVLQISSLTLTGSSLQLVSYDDIQSNFV